MNYEHLTEQDAMITAKDEENEELKCKLAGRERREGMSPHHREEPSATHSRAESPLDVERDSVSPPPIVGQLPGTGGHTTVGASAAVVVTPSPLHIPPQPDPRGDVLPSDSTRQIEERKSTTNRVLFRGGPSHPP